MYHSLQRSFQSELQFDRNEVFYDIDKCLGIFLSICQGEKVQCVSDEKCIVTACRQ